ncbi:hypothetical protein Glove_212g206 [Diversispora epigaea]|uniref:Uncharacterized protein n=1 Tax=Diversispora epigaea TaxID=1348612 RepID=A0A397II03_9GLOM|nr:hypothetical protein Glove_212g206 [Diversispora epigaea]
MERAYAKCAKIYRWMLERHALIKHPSFAKMIEFEKRASDLRSSFLTIGRRKMKKILLIQFNLIFFT